MLGIIEIGSNNTKTHIYDGDIIKFESSDTIEFKKNYNDANKIKEADLEKLFMVIDKAMDFTKDIHIYGCSIFRKISKEELDEINSKLKEKYGIEIEVVSQEDEANYTALGCYSDVQYDENMCVFIGGGGSIELIFVNKGKIIDKKYYGFGVVDVTKKYESLKDDIPTCTFDEVQSYIDSLIGEIETKADILILAGGDHLYWYNNAKYELSKNTIYEKDNQQFMLNIETSDKYDRDALVSSLDKVRANSDNPLWFDGSRAMKIITNLISHKVNAKYIIPTKINMEDGIKNQLSKQ